jgi:hypothetical protein
MHCIAEGPLLRVVGPNGYDLTLSAYRIHSVDRTSMNVQWAESSVELASPSELPGAIQTIRRLGRPTMVYLNRDGRTLVFGVGAAESVLTWMDANGEAWEAWHSVGDLSRKGCIQLWNGNQLDDFPAELAVPEQAGIDAAMSFASTGRRPENVRWEGDW